MNLRGRQKLFRTPSRRHLTNAAAGALRISMIQISLSLIRNKATTNTTSLIHFCLNFSIAFANPRKGSQTHEELNRVLCVWWKNSFFMPASSRGVGGRGDTISTRARLGNRKFHSSLSVFEMQFRCWMSKVDLISWLIFWNLPCFSRNSEQANNFGVASTSCWRHCYWSRWRYNCQQLRRPNAAAVLQQPAVFRAGKNWAPSRRTSGN